MKDFTFKYYPARILLFLLCIVLTLIILVKGYLQPEVTFIGVALWVIGSSSLVALIFTFFNKYAMWKYVLKILDIPEFIGSYEGELISSYQLDDDTNMSNVKKYVFMEVFQNLNGFIIESKFYDSKASKEFSSESISITHDILSVGNGKFTISYLYKNKANKFHKDNKKYKLNSHEGMAVLTYDPIEETLIGKYFNDSQERPSYGMLNLKKI